MHVSPPGPQKDERKQEPEEKQVRALGRKITAKLSSLTPSQSVNNALLAVASIFTDFTPRIAKQFKEALKPDLNLKDYDYNKLNDERTSKKEYIKQCRLYVLDEYSKKTHGVIDVQIKKLIRDFPIDPNNLEPGVKDLCESLGIKSPFKKS